MMNFTHTSFEDCDILLKEDPPVTNDSMEFVYFCKDYKQVVDLAVSNEIDLTRATHEWHDFICRKIIEDLFFENGAKGVNYKLYKPSNIIINEIEFDIEPIIRLNTRALVTRSDKNNFIKELHPNKNTIYIVMSSDDIFTGKWAFHNIEKLRSSITAFMQYYKDTPMNQVPIDNKNIFSEIININA